jgi:hypothetical protein
MVVRIEKEEQKIVIEIENRKLTFKDDKVEIHESDSDDFELRFYDEKGVCFPYKIGFNFNTIRGYIDRRECGVYKNVRMFLEKETVRDVVDLFRPFEFRLGVSADVICDVLDSLKKTAVHIGTEEVDFDTDNNMCIAVNQIYSLTEAPTGVLYG